MKAWLTKGSPEGEPIQNLPGDLEHVWFANPVESVELYFQLYWKGQVTFSLIVLIDYLMTLENAYGMTVTMMTKVTRRMMQVGKHCFMS